MRRKDPPPLFTVVGLCNHCLARFAFSLEKESNVMKALVVKNIIGKNHRGYVVDKESCLFLDLSLAARFE